MKRSIDHLYDKASPTMQKNIRKALADASSKELRAAGMDHENDRAGFFAGGYAPPLQTIHDKKKPAIRIPKKREPNKTEERFMEWATDRWRGCFVHYAPVTFHLPSGCKYTPDVMVRERPRLILGADDPFKLEFLTFIEVKGSHIHNQRSIHAFKEARAAFPFFRWIFAQYRDGEWALAELPL